MLPSDRLVVRADASDDRPAAVDAGRARDARRLAPEPAQGDDDPRPARRRGGDVHVGGRLATAAPLHDAGGRGRGGSDARRRDRREHARQVPRQGARGRGTARTPLPEPVRRPRDRPDPLRRDAERRGRDRGRRDRRPARRRRVLRHRHHREHRGARTVDHVVERRLGSRRPRPEPHGRLRGGEPRRPGVPRRDAFAHRRRRLGRGRPVPVGDDDGRRRRPGARAPDRVRRRARVRDPRPVDVRRARLGRGHGGRRDARDPAVRPGGAADPPAGEAAHPGRAGHGRRVRSVRGRSRLDGQGGQGRLPRQAWARGPRRRGAGRAARRVHVCGDVGAARGLERGPRRRLGGSGHLGPAERRGRGHRRPGLGARRAGRATGRRSRSSSAATARTRPSRCGRSTTPTARGSGRERAGPPLAARALARGPRRRAGPGGGVGARRALRGRGRRTRDPAREGRAGRRDGAGQDRRPGFARRRLVGGGRRPHRPDRRRLGAPAERTRRRGGPGPQGRLGGGPRRDGDRRDAPVRRVRARGTASCRRRSPG